MLELKLAFRSVARRGWRLLPVVLPIAVLFAMVSIVVATNASVRQLLVPGIASRTIRVGTMPGYWWQQSWFTTADVNKLGAVPGLMTAPETSVACNTDLSEPDEFECSFCNRHYLEVWEGDMPLSAAVLDQWDTVKNGAIVTKAAADKHHWKVGDHFVVHNTPSPEMSYELVITHIAEQYLNPRAVSIHGEYGSQRLQEVHQRLPVYWVVWLIVDRPERRAEVMKEVDETLTALNHPHWLMTMEDSVGGILSGSEFLRAAFQIAGALSLALVACLSIILLVVSINERNAQLATLLALGFRRGVLARSIVFEGVLLLLPAALLGALSVWAMFYDRPIMFHGNFNVAVHWDAAVITACVGLVIGIAAALIPAWRVYKLDMISSLR